MIKLITSGSLQGDSGDTAGLLFNALKLTLGPYNNTNQFRKLKERPVDRLAFIGSHIYSLNTSESRGR